MSKKYLIISIVTLIVIAGWAGLYYYLGVEGEMRVNPPSIPDPVIQNTETSTGVSENIDTNNWISDIDKSKEFSLDNYFLTWAYSVVQKFEKWPFTILTIDTSASYWTINSENWVSCMSYWFSSCKNFILKNKVMIYNNLQTNEDLWWVYKAYDNWVVFYNMKWEWTSDWTEIFWWWLYTFTYINFDTLKKIYEDYTESSRCKVDKNTDNCLKWTEKNETSKTFYDKPRWDSSRIALSLKATNMEDAYFEFYKESSSIFGKINPLKKADSPDGKKRLELYSDKDSCDCYSQAQCSISITDTNSNTEIEKLDSVQQWPCPVFPIWGIPLKWYDNESLVINSWFGDGGISSNQFSIYNLTQKKTIKTLWSVNNSNSQEPPITTIDFDGKKYYFQSNKENIVIYEVPSKNDTFIISDKKDPEKYTLDYTKLIKKASIQASGELSIIPDYTGIYFMIWEKSFQYNPETSKITFTESMNIPTETNPIIIWEGFLKTKLYVKNDLLYSFIVNDEEREIGNWNNDFRIIDYSWYFAMWWNLYYSSTASLWSIWQLKINSKIDTYACVNGLDLDWSFFVNGKKQEIKFTTKKNCVESKYINALYDDSGIYVWELSSVWEWKYFPGLDGKSLKKISENEIWDDRWNILISECWHAGCEYTKK